MAATLLTRSIGLILSLNLKYTSQNPKKLYPLTPTMSLTCSKCTFINPPFQISHCQICHSAIPQSLSPSPPSKPKWSCSACTFLNPYRNTICEMCGNRASASLLQTLEVNEDDLDEVQVGSSIGSVFLPLRSCSNVKRGNSEDIDVGAGCSGELRGGNGNLEKRESYRVGNDGGNKGFLSVSRPCSNKRKAREEEGVVDVEAANEAIQVESSTLAAGGSHLDSESKTLKILSYNVWFREDLEMHKRMKELGKLIEMHSPDVLCFQEVTPSFYGIFQKSNWWKRYRCSILNEMAFPGPYFCMQLSKLPVKSYTSNPFHNSIMGRELSVAELEPHPNAPLTVATTHLESPCPGPPTWDQMFTKERVQQAKQAITILDKHRNVIFCGDMNWDDKSDGPFPLSGSWVDAWTELRPGEIGYTYDTKSNKMLSGNRTLQKRLDRFVCKLKDFRASEIEMIGMDPIEGVSYVKEKKVKGQVKELVLPVLPSDHYGLILTICRS